MSTLSRSVIRLLPQSSRGVARAGCFVAAFCLAFAGAAYAQSATSKKSSKQYGDLGDVGSAVAAVAKVRAEQVQVRKEIGAAEAKYRRLATQLRSEERQRDAVDHQARVFNDSPQNQRLRREAQVYQATCAGKRLYGAAISRCNRAFNSIEPRRMRSNRIISAYFQHIRALQNKARRTRNEAVLAAARIKKLKNYLSWLTSADNKMLASMRQRCAALGSAPTIEEVKLHCGNVQFDNARYNLPPCTTKRCRQMVIRIKPRRTPQQAIEEYKRSGAASPTRNPHLDRTYVPPPPKN